VSRARDPWERRAEIASDHPLASLLFWGIGITAVVLVIVALVGLASTGSVFFKGAAAQKTVGARTKTQVFTPENKIAQIAFFHNTCNTAVAQLRIVKNNNARVTALQKAAKSSDPIRQQQAQDSLSGAIDDATGAANVLQATVADYNSRSAQSTANVFKGNNLPDRINLPDPIPATYTINCG
jgi:hypothetical protein